MKVEKIPKCPCKPIDKQDSNELRPNIILHDEDNWNSLISDE